MSAKIAKAVGRAWWRWADFHHRHHRAISSVTTAAVVLIALISITAGVIAWSDRTNSAHLAVTSCKRSKALGPELVRFYARYHAFTPAKLQFYKSTIPKHC